MLALLATMGLCLASLRGPKVSLRDSDLDKLKASMHLHGNKLKASIHLHCTKVMVIQCGGLLLIEIHHKRQNCALWLFTHSHACFLNLYSQTKYRKAYSPPSAIPHVCRLLSEHGFRGKT